MIRRKKIDVDFTVTNKERMHYEWYDVLRQYVRRKPPRLVISQQNLGMHYREARFWVVRFVCRLYF